MRYLALTVVASFCPLFLIGCISVGGPQVTGSGVPSTEERPVTAVDEVKLSGIGVLVVNPGSEPKLTVEADDNLLKFIKSNVNGKTLLLGFESGNYAWSTGYPRFTLEGVQANKFELSGQAKLEIERAEFESAKFIFNGQSTATLNGEFEQLTLEISGQARIELSGKIGELVVNASGQCAIDASDAEVGSISGSLSGQSQLICRESTEVKVEKNSESLIKRTNGN